MKMLASEKKNDVGYEKYGIFDRQLSFRPRFPGSTERKVENFDIIFTAAYSKIGRNKKIQLLLPISYNTSHNFIG